MNENPTGAVPPATDEMSYAEPSDLSPVRSFVRAAAVERGLAGARAELLTLAVNELTTNTLQHTSGGGLVRLSSDEFEVVCEVIDGGGERTFTQMPAADSIRGRGLAIVQRLVDEVSTFAGADGTVVQLRMRR